MIRLEQVVVGVDFSKYSLTALSQARRLLRGDDGLHVVHVIDEFVAVDLRDALRISLEELHESVCGEARARLAVLLGEAGADPARIDVRVVVGNPLVELLRAVAEHQADLLVLGEKGSWEQAPGAGSLATQCVRKAATRVLLVRETHRGAYRRVVACVDGSETSALALEEAILVARREEAHLDIIHVFAPPWRALHYRSPTGEAPPERQRQYRDGLDAFLRHFLQPYESDLASLQAHRHLVESEKVWSGIVEFLRNTGSDLAVMGTRGRTGLKRLLLGTTAERVLRASPCSILAVKPRGFVYAVG